MNNTLPEGKTANSIGSFKLFTNSVLVNGWIQGVVAFSEGWVHELPIETNANAQSPTPEYSENCPHAEACFINSSLTA